MRRKSIGIGAIILGVVLPVVLAFSQCQTLVSDMFFICMGRVSIVAMFYPIVIALIYRKSLNKPLRVFLVYCVATVVANLIEQVFLWLAVHHFYLVEDFIEWANIGNTNFLMILYQIKNFALLGWFYSLLLPLKSGKWVKRTGFALTIAALISYFFIEGHNAFSVFNTVDAVFGFLLPALYLSYFFRRQINFPVYKNPYFWISFGLVFANTIGLFVYLVGDTLQVNFYNIFVNLSIARNGFDVIAQILLSVGFWYAPLARYIALPVQQKKL